MTDKGIGIGVEDFKKVILEDIYYVDKTEYIKEVIDDKSEVLLITRPRRFGKTLNMSMLKYFFDANLKEYDKQLFNGLNIMKCGEKYIDEMGKYPVISISFANVKESSFEDMKFAITSVIADLYLEFEYILESDKISESEKKQFRDIVNYTANNVMIEKSILNLSKYLEKYYGTPVIILIDEYDAPLETAYIEGYYDNAINYIRSIYSLALKGNGHLKKAIVTRNIKS